MPSSSPAVTCMAMRVPDGLTRTPCTRPVARSRRPGGRGRGPRVSSSPCTPPMSDAPSVAAPRGRPVSSKAGGEVEGGGGGGGTGGEGVARGGGAEPQAGGEGPVHADVLLPVHATHERRTLRRRAQGAHGQLEGGDDDERERRDGAGAVGR